MIFRYLGYKRGDVIQILHDNYFSRLAQKIELYCDENSINATSIEIEYNPSKMLPLAARDALMSDESQIIVLGFLENIWHTSERKKAKYNLKKRLMNLLYAGDPCESYLTNVNEIVRRANCLFGIVDDNKGGSVHITSPGGTDLTAKIGNTFCENGLYVNPGSGGDFPSGEVGFGPIEESVNGILVYDVKIQYMGKLEKGPLKVRIRKDEIVDVEGRHAKEFLNIISKHPILKYSSEISIGVNPLTCSVEDPNSIIEEKNIGTFHVGNGGNQSYGSRKGPHFDGVVSKPTISIGNVVIMEDGKPISF